MKSRVQKDCLDRTAAANAEHAQKTKSAIQFTAAAFTAKTTAELLMMNNSACFLAAQKSGV